jgi:PAS domain S-box-containing protein
VENDLKQSEEKFICLFDTSPVLTSLATVADGQLIEANQVFYDVTGFSREEVIGKRSRDFGLWVDHRERVKAIATLSPKKHLDAYPVRLRRKNGAMRRFPWSAHVVDSIGEPSRATSGSNQQSPAKKMPSGSHRPLHPGRE